jgi:hypothetical protein
VKSGIEVVKTLFRAREKFRIKFKRWKKGSHIVLANRYGKNFSVPNHEEVKRGTLKGIIEDAGMERKDFLDFDP